MRQRHVLACLSPPSCPASPGPKVRAAAGERLLHLPELCVHVDRRCDGSMRCGELPGSAERAEVGRVCELLDFAGVAVQGVGLVAW